LFVSKKNSNFANVIELERHIEILLLSNDCVIIPGLGGFMAHHVEARFDESDNMFLPPLRTLGFNPQLKLNDSLLIQSYIEAYDISYPEAQRRIEAEVAELRQHLETEGHYELNDIGDLCLNSEGHLEFEPCEAGILTPMLYGLSSFDMIPLQQEAEEENTKDEFEEADIESSEDHTIKIKLSWIRNTVAVAAAVIAFFLIGTPISNSDMPDASVQQSTFIPLNTKNKVVYEEQSDSLSIAKDTSEDMATDQDLVNEEAAKSTIEESSVSPTFLLVLASQVTQHNAEMFVNQLRDAGFSEARLYQNKNMLRVVYGNYDSENKAYNALYQLRAKNKHFAEAWVLKIED